MVYTDGSVLDSGDAGGAAAVAALRHPGHAARVTEGAFPTEDACRDAVARLGLRTAGANLDTMARPDNNLAELGVAALLAVAAPDELVRGVRVEIRTDSKVLVDTVKRAEFERNERWRLAHPLAVVLHALAALKARRGALGPPARPSDVTFTHVKAHFGAANTEDRVYNSAADHTAKAVAARAGVWARAPPLNLQPFEPFLSVETTDGHAAGSGLTVAGSVADHLKKEYRLRADADASDYPERSQAEVISVLGPGRVRAAAKAARSATLAREEQVTLVRLVSGTVPTFGALAEWFEPTADGGAGRASEAGQTLAARFNLLRDKKRYRHVRAAVVTATGEATAACPFCARAPNAEAAGGRVRPPAPPRDTQSHWIDDCAATQDSWRREAITEVAIQVHASTDVDERHTWALARRLWHALTAHPRDDDQYHWLNRCGFFQPQRLVRLVADDDTLAAARTALRAVKPKLLDRVVRAALLRAASTVWRERIERFCAM